MESTTDPQWTEKLDTGRIYDPLQVDTVRNRILTDLLWGVTSIQIYQRLRYISFSLWCLENLDNPTQHDLVPFEKAFLLVNLAHDHWEVKNRGTNGLSGEENVPWSRDELRDPSNASFSISDDTFQIQSGGATGFSSYYRGIMDRLLLIDGLDPTALGSDIAAEFDQNIDIEFDELRRATDDGHLDQELVMRFTDSCCCLLDGREETLLRQAYFSLIASARTYHDLTWIEPSEAASLHIASESADAVVEFLDADGVSELDEYLRRYFQGQYGTKMRDSLTLFLWIAAQTDEYERPLDEVDELNEIRRLWRLQQYYDYFNYGCEALLAAVLQALRTHQTPVQPETLLAEIASHEAYGQSLAAVLTSIEIDPTEDEQRALDAAYQYMYYSQPIGSQTNLQLEPASSAFTGSWPELLEMLEARITPSRFNVDADVSEWVLQRLIEDELNDHAGSAVASSARIFGYITALFGLLKLRYEHVFSHERHEQYWNWLTKFEHRPPGPVSLLNSLESNEDVDMFVQHLARRWTIEQYTAALYEKTDPSRMPRLFSKDFKGRIDYQDSLTPGLTETKFDRLVDILFDLGLLASPSTDSFTISADGRAWLEFLGVEP